MLHSIERFHILFFLREMRRSAIVMRRWMGRQSHVSDDDPRIIDRALHNDRNDSSIPNAPGWNEELASDSELGVKADRTPEMGMKELQNRTIDAVHKKYDK
jgi:hypothetical protein